MLFTRIATFAAGLLCVLAASRVILAVVFGGDPDAIRRYLGSEAPGHYIDQAVVVFGIGIALGVLTDISRSVAKSAKKEESQG